MSAPAIRIESVSKRFRLYQERPSTLKERFLRLRGTRAEDFWALRDISYDLEEGKTLGLVGANGSGKTTLLKIIGGILRPTSGRVLTRGRIAALLELGAGFHPELTGRENVFLNASILGLSKRETERHFDEIVEFAELERFIDNQVKHYSSGMYVRLGFAVAVHVDPEILLVDEVLAVGDEGFQQKCLDRVRAFQREGRSIVFVTHAMDQVRKVCDEAIMLEQGAVRVAGEVADVIREFRLQVLKDKEERAPMVREDTSREMEILGVELLDGEGRPVEKVLPGRPLSIQVDLKANRPVDDPVVSLAIYDVTDNLLVKTGTDWKKVPLGVVDGKRRVVFDFGLIPWTDGRYHVTVAVHSRGAGTFYDWHDRRGAFEIDRSVRPEGQVFLPLTVRVEEL